MNGNNKNELKVRILAGVLAGIMILSVVAAALIYFI